MLIEIKASCRPCTANIFCFRHTEQLHAKVYAKLYAVKPRCEPNREVSVLQLQIPMTNLVSLFFLTHIHLG